jgi:NAD-specific glutamate dehydrogenase
MANFKTVDQLQEILLTDLYNSGEAFTIKQMAEKCTMVKHASRMNELLRLLMDDGYVQSQGSNQDLVYRKSRGEKWLRKRWISEVAKNLCSGDYFGNLTPKEGGDVGSSAREAKTSGSCPR